MSYQVDENEADLLSVEIPIDRRNKTPYNKMESLVEEYPVMILNENNEDSSISANVRHYSTSFEVFFELFNKEEQIPFKIVADRLIFDICI